MTTEPRNAETITRWAQERIAQTLECAPEEVDIDRQFDQLGLDSLAILMATGELAEWLDTELEAATLFECPTIRALSQHLATEE